MNARRASLAVLAGLWILLGAPPPALAKDVCLQDTPGKTPGSSRRSRSSRPAGRCPSAGLYIKAGETFPVHGAGVLRPSGNLEVGVLVHAMSEGAFVGHNFTASMQVSTTFDGTGALDSDGDYLVNSGLYGWVSVDCSTITIP